MPVDIALGVAIPLHSHMTCNMCISDYVPPSARSEFRMRTRTRPSRMYEAGPNTDK